MRDSMKSRVCRLGVWWLWVLVLLTLPNCVLPSQFRGGGLGPNLDPGSEPLSGAIFCDIEDVLGRRCATATDLATGVRLAAAAVALATGQTSNIGIDESPDARARCGGEPEAVLFRGPFPEGYSVCVNCLEIIPSVYPDANMVCAVQCFDFFGTVQEDGTFVPQNPPDPLTIDFCASRARVSTNAPLDGCFADACTAAGTLLPGFVDPRRISEPVVWADLIGVTADANNLTRTAPTTTFFDAGAGSYQWIWRGDAYLEFSPNEDTLSHVAGLSTVPLGCTDPAACPDTDPSLADIGFSISMNYDDYFYVIESGVLITTGPGLNGSFGMYDPGDRFRINVRDNSDNTATITYSKLSGPCLPGAPCPETVFYTAAGLAQYPLRINASFREVGATLGDVRVVRIR